MLPQSTIKAGTKASVLAKMAYAMPGCYRAPASKLYSPID